MNTNLCTWRSECWQIIDIILRSESRYELACNSSAGILALTYTMKQDTKNTWDLREKLSMFDLLRFKKWTTTKLLDRFNLRVIRGHWQEFDFIPSAETRVVSANFSVCDDVNRQVKCCTDIHNTKKREEQKASIEQFWQIFDSLSRWYQNHISRTLNPSWILLSVSHLIPPSFQASSGNFRQ